MPFNGERTTKVVSGWLWGSWHVGDKSGAVFCRSNAQLTNEQTVRVIINVLTLFMLFIGINPWDIYRDNHGIILRLVGILGINRDKNIYIYSLLGSSWESMYGKNIYPCDTKNGLTVYPKVTIILYVLIGNITMIL